MKKLSLALIVASTLTACANQTTLPVKLQTPAQIAEQICDPLSPLTIALGSLQALSGLPASAQADLKVTSDMVDVICKKGAAVDITSLKTLAETGLPLILQVAETAGMTAAAQNNVVLAVGAAQIIIGAVQAEQSATAVK